MGESVRHPETGELVEAKWAPFYACRNWRACDRYARERLGIHLHAGSTADEIAKVVSMYKASW